MKKLIRVFAWHVLLAVVIGCGCSRGRDADRFVASGNRYYDAYDYEKAKIQYVNALQRQHTNGVALLKLGKILYRQGQYREAYPFLKDARQLFPNDVEATRYMAIIYGSAGLFTNTLSEAMAVLATVPGDDDALRALVIAARKPEERRQVLTLIDQLQKSGGDKPAFHLVRAQFLAQQRDTASALVEVQKALEMDPKSVFANLTLGGLHVEQRSTNAAEKAFRNASELGGVRHDATQALAKFYVQTGRLDDAINVLDGVNKQAPELTSAWLLRADVALARKDYETADRIADIAMTQAPNSFPAMLIKARSNIGLKKTSSAVEVLQTLNLRFPNSAEALYHLGVAQAANKEPVKAIENLKRAVEIDTNNMSAVMVLVDLEITNGQAQSAISQLEAVQRRFTNAIAPQFELARAYQAAGRPDDALTLLRSMRKRFPDVAAVPHRIGLLCRMQQREAEQRFMAANYRLQTGQDRLSATVLRQTEAEARAAQADAIARANEARNAFVEANRLAPSDNAPVAQLLELEIGANAPDKALAILLPMLEKNPNSAELWLYRARVHLLQKQRQEAEAALDKAITLDPNNGGAYLLLAEVRLGAGDPKESLKRLAEYLKRSPGDLKALMLTGMISEQVGDYDAAQRAYESVVQINPNFVLALNNLAYLLCERRGRFDDALKFAEKAHEAAPSDPRIIDTLGTIHLRRGDYFEAYRTLADARMQLPDEVEIIAHYGLAAYMMGYEVRARENLAPIAGSKASFSLRPLAEKRLASLTTLDGLKPAEAIPTLEKMRSADPTDLIAVIKLADAYANIDDETKARAAIVSAYNINTNSVEVITRLAELELEQNTARATELARWAQRLDGEAPRVSILQSQLTLKSGDPVSAFALSASAVQRMPDDPKGWFVNAETAFSTGNLSESTRSMLKARELGLSPIRSKIAGDYPKLIEACLKSQYTTEDRALVERVYKESPKLGAAALAMARLREIDGKHDEARILHEGLLQRYKGFPPSLKALAILHARHLKDDSKAYDYARRVRAVLPDDLEVTLVLAEVAFNRGEYRYAVELYSEATSKQATNAGAFYRLGVAYGKLNQTANSRAAIEKAISLDPKAEFVPAARKLLSELKGG